MKGILLRLFAPKLIFIGLLLLLLIFAYWFSNSTTWVEKKIYIQVVFIIELLFVTPLSLLFGYSLKKWRKERQNNLLNNFLPENNTRNELRKTGNFYGILAVLLFFILISILYLSYNVETPIQKDHLFYGEIQISVFMITSINIGIWFYMGHG